MNTNELVKIAVKAMDRAYSPYSNFKVGAALITKDGMVYQGCNIENASYSATCCAERTALFTAVSEGERDFEAIAIVGGENGVITDRCPPCGVCRQALSEFCSEDFKVILFDGKCAYEYSLGELLPNGFSKNNL